jgi:hypothetical protein
VYRYIWYIFSKCIQLNWTTVAITWSVMTNEQYLITIALTTTELITSIVAIQYSVALVRLLYTLPEVGTFELCRWTRDWRTTFFVLIVETVVVAIAHPRLRNTVTRPWASKLKTNDEFPTIITVIENRQRSRAMGWRYTYLEIGTSFFCAKIAFVGTIPTVVFRVTFPCSRYAATIIT